MGKRNQDYEHKSFEQVARKSNKYLKRYNISLNFRNYKETIMRYYRLQDNDVYEAFELSKECNLWSNYMSDTSNLVQVIMLDMEISIDYLNSYLIKDVPIKELNDKIEERVNEYKDVKKLYKYLVAQQKFFIGAFFHSHKTYLKGVSALEYKY